MAFIPLLNAGAPQGLPMGYINAQLGELNTVAVQLNPNSTATFIYGMPVKIIGQNPNGMTIVDAITANTDPIWGVIVASSYLQQVNLTKGLIVTILQSGLQSKIKMLVTATVTAGQAVGWVVASNGIAPNAVVAQRLGIAQENGAVGSFVDVLITVPNATNANF